MGKKLIFQLIVLWCTTLSAESQCFDRLDQVNQALQTIKPSHIQWHNSTDQDISFDVYSSHLVTVAPGTKRCYPASHTNFLHQQGEAYQALRFRIITNTADTAYTRIFFTKNSLHLKSNSGSVFDVLNAGQLLQLPVESYVHELKAGSDTPLFFRLTQTDGRVIVSVAKEAFTKEILEVVPFLGICIAFSENTAEAQTIKSINDQLKIAQPKSLLIKNLLDKSITLKIFDFYHPDFEESDFSEDMAILPIFEHKYQILSPKGRGEDENGCITGTIVPQTYISPYREKTESNATVLISYETIQPKTKKNLEAAQLSYIGRLHLETEAVDLTIQ